VGWVGGHCIGYTKGGYTPHPPANNYENNCENKIKKKFKKIVDIISKQGILVFKLAITLTYMSNLYEY